ncbi:antibiotic biosynthesis monooxygenase [Streptomyces sp. CB01881]|uniref:putative quinol monooxygenase n=1 Tax=Streptomyces sp. CB01881 TaxID=2078691 RepID=UPI0011E069C1|nr:antibiotic biosynthesis monooxygenase family protein [Streptomyces sp. CB01881]TYC66673.1 antibiotic biosynthesis monooxygenase [Streptomyces sp. CB01881]
MSIVVIADWLAAPGSEQRVAGLLPTLTDAALAQPGVLAFRAVRSQRDHAAFVVIAEYEDRNAHAAHREADHYRALVLDGIAPLLIDRQSEEYALL